MFEINGKIVGSVSLEMDENEISEFIIEPKFQQKGYGKKMYKLTEISQMIPSFLPKVKRRIIIKI